MTISLSAMFDVVNALRSEPFAGRSAKLNALLPDLEEAAAEENYGEEHRINLLAKAIRLIRPAAPRPATVAAARDLLRQLTTVEIGVRGPGRPGIGPATTVRFPTEVYDQITVEAIADGHIDGQGRPIQAAAIRDLVVEALTARHAEQQARTGQ